MNRFSKRSALVLLLISVILSSTFASAQWEYYRKTKEQKTDLSGLNILIGFSFNIVYTYNNLDLIEPEKYQFAEVPSQIGLTAGLGLFYEITDRFLISATFDYIKGNELLFHDLLSIEHMYYRSEDSVNLLVNVLYRLGGRKKFYLTAGAGTHFLLPRDIIRVKGKVMEETITIHQSGNNRYPIAAIGIGRFVTSHNLDLVIELKYYNVFELGKSSLSFKIGAFF